jgi:pimeloyl-ACP methyl ester carboxylesterase
MTPSLHFIHGLNNSHVSFAYLAKELEGTAKINYNSHQPLALSLVQVAKQIPKNEPVVLIGHSLGGVIAALLALENKHQVQKLITISSPLGGSKAAHFARWVMPSLEVLRDLIPTAPHIQQLTGGEFKIPVLSLVSSAGHLPALMGGEPNDSVVTLSSQRAIKQAKKVDIKINHMEVLSHDKTVESIRKFLAQ